MASSRDFTVSCMCGVATHTFNVPTSTLPLPTHLCSCNISRRISGSLLTSYINITHGTNPPKPNLSALTPYKSSNILTRHFCSTCGTQMYLEYNNDGHFEAATGTLQVDSTDGIIDYKAHIWIGDTPDRGASEFIVRVNDKELKRYLEEPGQSAEEPHVWPSKPPTTKASKGKPVHAHCHCNGVHFYVQRPNEASKTASSPYPDLLKPYHLDVSDNPNNETWWLRKNNRYLAGTCACQSCRRASGFDITFWAFVPAVNITLDEAGTQPLSRTPYWGTMKCYSSSANVTRTFCSTCGANVFWDGDWRPSLVDVAVGLLDAGSGARAEEILEWWPERVSFEEFALNKALIKGLREGLLVWATKEDEGGEEGKDGKFPFSEPGREVGGSGPATNEEALYTQKTFMGSMTLEQKEELIKWGVL